MAAFPNAAAAAMLSQKRKAEPEVDVENVSTLHVRPGGVNVVGVGAQAAALNLRFGGSSAKAAKLSQDEEGAPLAVDVSGFERKELNARYTARPEMVIFGRRTYWTRGSEAPASSRHFLIWQKTMGRWAICERISSNGGGQSQTTAEAEELEFCGNFCRWMAFQLDQVHFLDSCRWMELSDEGWVRAENARLVPAAQTQLTPLQPPANEPKPIAVDFVGFSRLELNARYNLRTDIVLQGKPSYWEATNRFFVYWQGNLRRWAICGKRALDAARQGQCPGCACQLDQVHFTTSSRWVEYRDGGWVSMPVEVVAHGEQQPFSTEAGAAAMTQPAGILFPS
mmetsp:Transcript_78571/g.130164  ORF Transcript_78571/g.130164 Transcript_78571/m.130164 type:complete len:338 (-) Transcript_78571:20-1033(-)